MADQIQLRGGTTVEHADFTGAVKECTVDTTKSTLVVHDGATKGGFPLLRQDLSNLPAGTIPSSALAYDTGPFSYRNLFVGGCFRTALGKSGLYPTTNGGAYIFDNWFINTVVNSGAPAPWNVLNDWVLMGAGQQQYMPALTVSGTATTGTLLLGQCVESLMTAPFTGNWLVLSAWVKNVSATAKTLTASARHPSVTADIFGATTDFASLNIPLPPNVWTRVVFPFRVPNEGSRGLRLHLQFPPLGGSDQVKIAMAQLERGNTPTPFEVRPIALEKTLIERYYEEVFVDFEGYGQSMGHQSTTLRWKTEKRTTPTVSIVSTTSNTTKNITSASPDIDNLTISGASYGVTPAATGGFRSSSIIAANARLG